MKNINRGKFVSVNKKNYLCSYMNHIVGLKDKNDRVTIRL